MIVCTTRIAITLLCSSVVLISGFVSVTICCISAGEAMEDLDASCDGLLEASLGNGASALGTVVGNIILRDLGIGNDTLLLNYFAKDVLAQFNSRIVLVHLEPGTADHELLLSSSHGSDSIKAQDSEDHVISQLSKHTNGTYEGTWGGYITTKSRYQDPLWIVIMLKSNATSTAELKQQRQTTSRSTRNRFEKGVVAMAVGAEVGLLAVLLLFTVIFAGKISDPLQDLCQAMDQVASMDLENISKRRVSYIEEIRSMESSFTVMVSNLFKYRAHMNQAVLVDDDGDECNGAAADVATVAVNPLTKRFSTSGLRERQATILAIGTLGHAQNPDEAWVRAFVPLCLEVFREKNGVTHLLAADSLTTTFNCHSNAPRHWAAGVNTYLALESSAVSIETATPWNAAISSGHVYAGTIGDSLTKTHTCFGRPISLCKSLLSLGRAISAKCVVSASTRERMTDPAILVRPIDVIRPDSVAECVHEIVKHRQYISKDFSEGFEAFKMLNAGAAVLGFQRHLANAPRDKQAHRLLQIALQPGFQTSNYCKEPRSEWEEEQHITPGSPGSPFMGLNQPFTRKSSTFSIGKVIEEAVNRETINLIGDVPTRIIDRENNVYYRSTKLLGRGNFGEVWTGMEDSGGFAALKTLPLPQGQKPTMLRKRRSSSDELKRLANEIKLLSDLRHDNIVTYFGLAITENHLIVIMEYMPGGSLADVIKSFTRLPPNCMTRYLRDMLRGLAYLHSSRVIHRDIKPENVLLMNDGQCKLADFGASWRLDSGDTQLLGTPLYMSPEACLGFPTFRSDIWSLGVTVAVCLTGTLPYGKEALSLPHSAFIYQLGRLQTINPVVEIEGVPGAFQAILAMCFKREESERPAAGELLESALLQQVDVDSLPSFHDMVVSPRKLPPPSSVKYSREEATLSPPPCVFNE